MKHEPQADESEQGEDDQLPDEGDPQNGVCHHDSRSPLFVGQIGFGRIDIKHYDSNAGNDEAREVEGNEYCRDPLGREKNMLERAVFLWSYPVDQPAKSHIARSGEKRRGQCDQGIGRRGSRAIVRLLDGDHPSPEATQLHGDSQHEEVEVERFQMNELKCME